MSQTYKHIMEEIGWPAIVWVPHTRFHKMTRKVQHGLYGISETGYGVYTTYPGTRGWVLVNTHWHEVGHILWPWRQHWWIWLYGYVMAGCRGNNREEMPLYGHTVDDLPPRDRLLELTRRQVVRYNNRKGG